MKPRKNETIGGGVIIFRRGKRTGRVATPTSHLPYEHASTVEAMAEAQRLAARHPGETFEVFISTGMVARQDAQPTDGEF